MLIFRVNLLAGLLNAIIDFAARILKYFYRLLKALRLRLLFTVCAAGALAELFWNALSGNTTNLIVFITLAGVTAVRFLYNIFYVNSAKTAPPPQQPKQPQQPNRDYAPDETRGYYPHDFAKPQRPAVLPPKKIKPRYFRVTQNPQYIMAEYPDRYELFLKNQTGLSI